MGVFKNIGESFGGFFLSLSDLYGRTDTPSLPGDPTFGRKRTNTLESLTGSANTGSSPYGDRDKTLSIFDEMDRNGGLPSAVLNMHTADTLSHDEDDSSPFIVTGPSKAAAETKRMLRDSRIEQNISDIVRDMLKYGSDMPRLVYANGQGVRYVNKTDARKVKIAYDSEMQEIKGYVEQGRRYRAHDTDAARDAQGNKNPGSEISYPWDYVHFKSFGRSDTEPYGRSLLQSGVRYWMLGTAAEDAAIINRISRAPDRYKYLIDVGDVPDDDAHGILQSIQDSTKARKIFDSNGRRTMSEFRPPTPAEDIYLAVRPDSNTDVSMLYGSNSGGDDLNDIKEYSRMFLQSTDTPPSVFGYADLTDTQSGDTVKRSKSAAQQDFRYARRVMQHQRATLHALDRINAVHARLLTSDPRVPAYDSQAVKIRLRPPSYLLETQRLENMELRGRIAIQLQAMTSAGTVEPVAMTAYIFRDILRFTDEEVAFLVPGSEKVPTLTPEAAKQALPALMSSHDLVVNMGRLAVLTEGLRH